MNIHDAAAILRSHNEWRRGNKTENWHDPMPYSPAELGRAIDVICGHFSRQKGMVSVPKRATTAMLDAAKDNWSGYSGDGRNYYQPSDDDVRAVWRVMVNAAQQPAQGEKE